MRTTYLTFICPCGGIGRHSGFKIRRRNPSRFESEFGHQPKGSCVRRCEYDMAEYILWPSPGKLKKKRMRPSHWRRAEKFRGFPLVVVQRNCEAQRHQPSCSGMVFGRRWTSKNPEKDAEWLRQRQDRSRPWVARILDYYHREIVYQANSQINIPRLYGAHLGSSPGRGTTPFFFIILSCRSPMWFHAAWEGNP